MANKTVMKSYRLNVNTSIYIAKTAKEYNVSQADLIRIMSICFDCVLNDKYFLLDFSLKNYLLNLLYYK